MEISFDLSLPIDFDKGIKGIGDEDTFYSIMEGFEDMTLAKNLMNMKEQIENSNYPELRGEAHSLKGASGYLAAGRLHQLSEKIQKSIDSHDTNTAINLYPRLIEESIYLKLFIKKTLSKKKSK